MTDIRANWDPHDGQGRTPDRRARDERVLGGLTAAMAVVVLACGFFIAAYYIVERLFGTVS